MTEALWAQVISAIAGLAATLLSAYLAKWTANRNSANNPTPAATEPPPPASPSTPPLSTPDGGDGR